jgi:hypothetical protein
MIVKSKYIKALIHNRLSFFSALIFYFFVCSFSAFSQDDPPSDVATSPTVAMSESESKKLSVETNIKKRIQLSIESMELRLKETETFNEAPKFKEALSELGGYQAILEDSVAFLEKNDLKSNKVQDNFKKLEILLKKHISRLELIRREMPYKYGWHVQKLMKLVRAIRSKAVEPLFGTIS